MKVVMVANWWYRRGGLGNVMLDEAAELRRGGHDVVPFASAHPLNEPSSHSRYFPPFVETRDLAVGQAPIHRARAAARIVRNRDAGRAFASLLDAVRPDVVHVHNTPRQLSSVVMPITRSRGIPIVMTLHDYGVVCPQNLLLKAGTVACVPPNCVRGNVLHAVTNRCVKGSLMASLLAAVETGTARALGHFLRMSTILVAPSQFLAGVLARGSRRHAPIRVLPNGVRDLVRAPGPPGRAHVLFQGRLVPEKGVAVLVEAAGRLPSIPFVVAGDGPLRDALERTAPPNVSFVGHRDRGELDALLADAAMVVSPSTWFENAPLSVLEAMRAGRPVIVTDIGGQPELVADGGGLIVPPGNATALAGAIERLWRSDAESEELGRRARAAYRAGYTLEGHMAGLMRVYEDAAGAAAGAGQQS